jgi:hypothetical protein
MESAESLSGRAGIAGLQWLLLGVPAHETLRGALAGLLEDGAVLGEVMLQRAKYKPGRYLTTYHAAQVVQGSATSTHLVEANWRMPGGADPRGELSELLIMQDEAGARGLASPFRALLAEDSEWGLYIQVFPLDVEFPKLARLADPDYVCKLLGTERVVEALAPAYQITPIRYRPGQRHVLRYDPLNPAGQADPQSALFAKVYNSDKGARTVAVATRVSDWLAEQDGGIHAVRPLAYIAGENLALYPHVRGTPLSELLRDGGPAAADYLYAAGRAIRALHTTPETLVELQPHSFAKELKSITSASEHIAPLLPATGVRIRAILEQAQALHQVLPEDPPAFAYGDFKADHLWVTPAGMTLIDFDTCYLCDPAIDLGKFLADIQWWHDVYGLGGVAEAQSHFLAGYGEITTVRRGRARLYEALVLTKSTVRRVKLFDSDWAPRTERLIARADQVLKELVGSGVVGTTAKPPTF